MIQEDLPVISIVVPNFNSDRYIKEFLGSMIKQTYSSWELIIVDDGSSDHSLEIIKQYAETDKRIRFYYPEGAKGACARRNQGLRLAKGEFICFFDSDDIVPEDSLKTRVEEISSNTSADFIVSPAISFYKNPGDTKRLVLGFPFFKDDLDMFLKRYRLPFGVWTNTYRKSYLERKQILWDENLKSLQDSDFNIQALKKESDYAFSNDINPAYYWRIGGNPNSITKTIKSKENMESQIYFYDKLWRDFKDSKYNKSVRRFGLTLLQRCALLGYDIDPEKINCRKSDYARYILLRKLYACEIFRKASIITNWLLFPVRMTDEYVFRIKNRISCHNYFKKICIPNSDVPNSN